VPDPRETVPDAKDLQSESSGWLRGREEMPGRAWYTIPSWYSNRERELGLDRRETG
jgi:hypothetical protein